MQSLDFTFIPDDGIAGKSGTLAFVNPETGRLGRAQPLAKHPRKLEVWGLDIRALQSPGAWTFAFTIEGPAGAGKGELRNLQELEQPGPPKGVSWSISLIPLIDLAELEYRLGHFPDPLTDFLEVGAVDRGERLLE